MERSRIRRLLRRRAARWIVLAGVVVALLGGVGMLIVTSLANSAPIWWRSVNIANESTRQLAVSFENAVSNQLTSSRPVAADLQPGERWRSEPWRVAIEPREVNAWLNARMPGWLEARGEVGAWPRELEELQVDFDRGQIRVGVRVQASGRSQIVTAHLRPTIDDDGAIWLPAERLNLGRLPLPKALVLPGAQGWASSAVPDDFGEQADLGAMFDLFRGLMAQPEPVVRLPDGRQVRLLAVHTRNGRLELTCRTEVR